MREPTETNSTKLDEIAAGQSLAGVEPALLVAVVAVVPLADDALQL